MTGRGEAEFWPSGDDVRVWGIFRGNVTGADLTALADLLRRLDGDRDEDLLCIQFAVRIQHHDLHELTAGILARPTADPLLHGPTKVDIQKQAAFELFETYWPNLYKAWEQDSNGILSFDTDDFLDSPLWSTYEVSLGDQEILMVVPA